MDRASLTRRRFLDRSRAAVAGIAVITLVPFSAAKATPEALEEAIKEILGGKTLNEGKVTLDIPPLVENGNTVPMKVSVASPMNAKDHVRAIHVLNEKNPQPHVMHAVLGPRSGKAQVQAHIKLADSQKIVAIAELSDGSFWTASTDVIVTIAACTEDLS